MHNYDAIVVGVGGVGSAALFHLAARGARVLGIDRFEPPHDRGSSHGQTRIIRKAYFEHPDYVPLLHEAYRLWSELETRSGTRLFQKTGLLQIGPPRGAVIPGVIESAERHGLDIVRLEAEEVRKAFGGFDVPAGSVGVLEPDAGYLFVEACIQAHLRAAIDHGADMRLNAVVDRWRIDSNGVTVSADGETFTAARLVVTAGAWAGEMLTGLGVRLNILRKHLHWYANQDARYRLESGCPVFLYELGTDVLYGFPQIDELGLKVAAHSGGEVIHEPSALDRGVDDRERDDVTKFVTRYLPGVSPMPTSHAVCMYTMSADEHFIVDRHPAHPQIVFAAGLSGHGFKFASVLGKAMADLALDEATHLPIEFLTLTRPGLQEA